MKKILALLIMIVLAVGITVGLALSINPGDTASEPAASDNSAVSQTGTSDTPSSGTSSDTSSPEASEAESESSKEPEKQVYSFLACGDNIMHTSVLFGAVDYYAKVNGTTPNYSSMATANYDFDLIYHNIKELVANTDLAYINQETLVGGDSIRSYPTFCSPDAIGYEVAKLGFDVVNMAHNHMLDAYSSAYLKNCNKFFTDLGLTALGYYEDKAATENIKIVTVGDVKIAFLTYAEHTNGLKLTSGDTTVLPLLSDKALIRLQVAIAKAQADLVFVSVHWGDEDNSTSTGEVFNHNYSKNQNYVNLFLELNIDAVIGMHSHVLETCEWRTRADGGRTFIAYSLGNLVSGMYYGRNMLGAMLSMNIVKDGDTVYIEDPVLIPTVMHYVKGTKVSSSKSDIKGSDTGFRENEIYLLEDYSEELAAAHGCHAKDDASFSSSKRFTFANLIKRVIKTLPEEFIPESIIDIADELGIE
ncbi:MAG TPA: CapA family protein [Bacillota bacterium]|nr:CapA family protein [Bacillota bacterium]